MRDVRVRALSAKRALAVCASVASVAACLLRGAALDCSYLLLTGDGCCSMAAAHQQQVGGFVCASLYGGPSTLRLLLPLTTRRVPAMHCSRCFSAFERLHLASRWLLLTRCCWRAGSTA